MSELDYDSETTLSVGSVSAKSSSYDGLTDEQADALQAELEAKDARRIPIGFRATRARQGASRRDWPVVPHFDERG